MALNGNTKVIAAAVGILTLLATVAVGYGKLTDRVGTNQDRLDRIELENTRARGDAHGSIAGQQILNRIDALERRMERLERDVERFSKRQDPQ